MQRLLPLETIDHEVVWLRGNLSRAVLECGAVNFALKSKAEQEAILVGFRRFLNGLTHPLQVLVRVLPADIDGYLRGIEAADHDHDLRQLARDHAAFAERLARERALLDRRTYVVVPGDAAAGPRLRSWRGTRARHDRASGREAAAGVLAHRCADVVRELSQFGVAARRLAGAELVAVWRATTSGETSAVAEWAAAPVVIGLAVRGEDANA